MFRFLLSSVRACLVPLVLLTSSNAIGQVISPAVEEAQRRQQEKIRQEIERLRRNAPGSASPSNQQGHLAGEDGICFPVNNIEVEGVNIVSTSKIQRITGPFIGRCVGIASIGKIQRDITSLYIKQGYIAARTYIPEQDLNSGILKYVVIEGSLDGYTFNGSQMDSDRLNGILGTAFPGLVGKPVNLRDLEQGLDQIKRLQSQKNASTEVLPGEEAGSSILAVSIPETKRWAGKIGVDLLGQVNTGIYQSFASFGFDNLFGINDNWNINYKRSSTRNPWNFEGKEDQWGLNQFSNSISGSFSIPYGYLTFSGGASHYNYDNFINGYFSKIDTDGVSESIWGSIDLLVHRNQVSKTNVTATLTSKSSKNFLEKSLIEVSSRRLSIATFGISHSRRFAGGLWTFSANYDRGLPIFNAIENGDPLAGEAMGQFDKFSGTVSLQKPFEAFGTKFTYNGFVTGQWSDDVLFGSEHIAIGGFSSVRGVRSGLYFGNRGLYSRNELSWKLPLGSGENQFHQSVKTLIGDLKPYVAFDIGHIFGQSDLGIPDATLSGWTVGLKNESGRFFFDLAYSDIASSSEEIPSEVDRGLFYFSAGIKF